MFLKIIILTISHVYLVEHSVHTHAHTWRERGYLRVKEALFQRYDARPASECCYIPSAHGHPYFYRKTLWNTPLHRVYWLHGSSSVSVRARELKVRAPPRRIYRGLSDDTAETSDFFTADFAKIWYVVFYFLSLWSVYLSLREDIIVDFYLLLRKKVLDIFDDFIESDETK